MSQLVRYERHDGVATLTMDDGKKNALSLDMLTALGAALDQAARDEVVVILTGREGVFSAGFDLKTLAAGGEAAYRMLFAGFELSHRMLRHPRPILAACPGHALAMGAFLLLSTDLRIGVDGNYKLGATEVAIGMTMPHFGVEICRQRLSPAHFHRSVINAEVYRPGDAVTAGFLDRVVPESELRAAAEAAAAELVKLDAAAHAATKLRAREQSLTALRTAIDTDAAQFGPMRSGTAAPGTMPR